MSDLVNKVNVYIDSKNRTQDETTNKFKVIIPEGLLKCNQSEYFTLNVSCFNCFNTIYQCNTNSNSFQLILRNNMASSVESLYLKVGNPSVNDLIDNLNTLLAGKCVVQYVKTQNIFVYNKSSSVNPSYRMYIKPINSFNFLGLPNNIETLIDINTYSLFPINVNTIRAINITIDKHIPLDNSNIDNVNIVSNHSDIIYQKALDVPPCALISYENVDGGDSFQYSITNMRNIHSFKLSVYDQNMNLIPDMPDYLMHIQFNIRRKEQIISLLKNVIDYMKELYLMLSHIFEKIFSMPNI